VLKVLFSVNRDRKVSKPEAIFRPPRMEKTMRTLFSIRAVEIYVLKATAISLSVCIYLQMSMAHCIVMIEFLVCVHVIKRYWLWFHFILHTLLFHGILRFIYISSNATQYSKNTTQQELFNIIETPLGTDFLVNRVIPNVTLLKCMCKAVYYTKKIRRSFSISHNLHTSMVEGK